MTHGFTTKVLKQPEDCRCSGRQWGHVCWVKILMMVMAITMMITINMFMIISSVSCSILHPTRGPSNTIHPSVRPSTYSLCCDIRLRRHFYDNVLTASYQCENDDQYHDEEDMPAVDQCEDDHDNVPAGDEGATTEASRTAAHNSDNPEEEL